MNDSRHRIADSYELSEDGSRILTEIHGREIAVFRVDGELHALANFCPHQSGPLCEGELTGTMKANYDDDAWRYDETEDVVVCPWHGWQFEVKTGKNPQTDRYRVPTYEITEDEEGIYVELS